MILRAVIVLGAYLIGSIPSALILVWLLTGKDVRREGSGNVGGTNALRTAGWSVGVSVTLIDIVKGAAPVLAMTLVDPRPPWIAAAVLAAVLGHCFPVWLDFAGGKGVATGLGGFLVVHPWAALAAIGVWIATLGLGRWVSLASMVAAASFPLVLWIVARPDPVLVGAVAAAAMLIVLRHRSNIQLLASGREPRLPPWTGRRT